MSTLIRDLPRFHNDCKNYEQVINRVKDVDAKVYQKLNTMYADFLIKVEAVDRSVEDIVNGFVAVGLQHGTYVEELKKIRLKFDKEISNAKKLIEKHATNS
jgi:hypothetical protein